MQSLTETYMLLDYYVPFHPREKKQFFHLRIEDDISLDNLKFCSLCNFIMVFFNRFYAAAAIANASHHPRLASLLKQNGGIYFI